MSNMSDYLEVQLGKLLLCTQVAWKPPAIWVSLHTAQPAESGSPSNEVTGGNYGRVQITQADAQWNIPTTTGLFTNVNQVTFSAPNANWGQITHFGIWDAQSSGNLLAWGALSTPKTVNNGDPAPYFAAAQLQLTFA